MEPPYRLVSFLAAYAEEQKLGHGEDGMVILLAHACQRMLRKPKSRLDLYFTSQCRFSITCISDLFESASAASWLVVPAVWPARCPYSYTCNKEVLALQEGAYLQQSKGNLISHSL